MEGNEIIAQCGFNDYVPRNYKAFDFLSAEEFKKLVSKSEFVISHAGTGTVVSAVKEGKRLLFFQDWQNITSIWIITNWSFVNFLKKQICTGSA